MVKVTVFYEQPDDPAAFEKYYNETHVPKYGATFPNCIRLEASKAVANPGETPPYYRLGDLWFEDMASMQAGLASPQGQIAVADLENFAKGKYKIMVGEVTVVPLKKTAAV